MKNSDDSYYIVSGDRAEILEFISSEENLKRNLLKLSSEVGGCASAGLPYDISDFCHCKEERFGMVYFTDDKMKEKITAVIFMNIALD